MLTVRFLWFFLGCLCFGVVAEKLWPSPRPRRFPPVFSSESFYNFGSSVQVSDPFRVHFCVWCEVGAQHHLWKGLFLFS